MGNQGIRQGKISPPPITIHFQVFARLQGACNVFLSWHLATLHLAAPKGTILGGLILPWNQTGIYLIFLLFNKCPAGENFGGLRGGKGAKPPLPRGGWGVPVKAWGGGLASLAGGMVLLPFHPTILQHCNWEVLFK